MVESMQEKTLLHGECILREGEVRVREGRMKGTNETENEDIVGALVKSRKEGGEIA
jgi:hypothetical protein